MNTLIAPLMEDICHISVLGVYCISLLVLCTGYTNRAITVVLCTYTTLKYNFNTPNNFNNAPKLRVYFKMG